MILKRRILLLIFITLLFSYIAKLVNSKSSEAIYDINKSGTKFSYIRCLYFKKNKLFFIGNICDIMKTHKPSNIPNPDCNFLCSYDMSMNKLVIKKFPDIFLPIKFFLHHGDKYLYLVGFETVFCFKTENLEVETKKKLGHKIIPDSSFVIKDNITNKEYLGFYKYSREACDGFVEEERKFCLSVLEGRTLRQIFTGSEVIQPTIHNDTLYYGKFLSNKTIRISSFGLSKEKHQDKIISREIPIYKSPKYSSDFLYSKLYYYNGLIFLCLRKEAKIIDSRGEIRLLLSSRKDENLIFRYWFFYDYLFITRKNELFCYDLHNRKLTKFTKLKLHGYKISNILYNEKKKIAYICCQDVKSDHSLILSVNGQGKVIRKMQVQKFKEASIGGNFLYLLYMPAIIKKYVPDGRAIEGNWQAR